MKKKILVGNKVSIELVHFKVDKELKAVCRGQKWCVIGCLFS